MARRSVRSAGFKFQPFSHKQKQVLTWWMPSSGVSDYEGIIADGAIRSGKTVSMALSYVMWAMSSFREENFGMCGKTIGSFRRNVLGPLQRMLRTRGYKYAYHRADNYIEIRRGSVINYFYIFGGKDESSQDLVQGITLAGVLFDEVALMPESFVNQATARCSVEGSKFWFNCNPDSPEHWFKKEWIDKLGEESGKHLIYLHFTMDDNLSLSEETKARYRGMYSGVFYQRFILGEWCVAEGLVYTEFTEVNIKTEHAANPQRWFISIDYGTFNAFSAGLWSWDGKKAQREREFYYSGREEREQLTDDEYYTKLEELAGNLTISCVVIDPSAASFITLIRKKKRFQTKKAKNDVLDGIRFTAACLKAGLITVHESCESCLREFKLYRWNEKATTDTVIKENDHAMDDTRYFAYTILRPLLRSAYKDGKDKTISMIFGGQYL